MIQRHSIAVEEQIRKIDAEFNAIVRNARKVLKVLNEEGLLTYSSLKWYMGYDGSAILRIGELSDLPEISALLHRILPGIKRKGSVEMWSPYDPIVLTQWAFDYHGFFVKVWHESTIDTAPLHLAGPCCHFEKSTSERHTLVCQKGE